MNNFLILLVFIAVLFLLSSWIIKNKMRGRKRVLIIDDDRAFAKLVKTNLTRQGYDALAALDGQTGMHLATFKKPHLIILDVILPDIKGWDVCAKLKEDSRTKDIPIIFLTVKDSPEDIRAELEAGAIAHLTKPVSNQELLDQVGKILGE